jgi:MurNAc alpha-1-phosphate uridylyltransferase
MKAMILAAGKGTRLQTITQNKPKALVEVGGMSMLERLIIKLKVQGVSSIVINVHHFADQIISFLEEKENFNIPIHISWEKEELLETGGGILHAEKFLEGEESFIVHNVDILSDIDLRKLYAEHNSSGALATLAVKNRTTSRYLLFDQESRMYGWENQNTGERIIPAETDKALTPFAFSGIHVISPKIFPLFTETGSFSIIKTYLRLCAEQQIKAYRHDEGLWIDAGKPEGLALANRLLTPLNG